MPFIFAVTIREYMKAARSPLRSKSAKRRDFRLMTTPRKAVRPWSSCRSTVVEEAGDGLAAVRLEHAGDRLGDGDCASTSCPVPRASIMQLVDQRQDQALPGLEPHRGVQPFAVTFRVEHRDWRATASSATGEMSWAGFRLRAFSSLVATAQSAANPWGWVSHARLSLVPAPIS